MPLTIPDDLLHAAGLSEREALIEFACRLFETGKVPLWVAAQGAGLTRIAFEEELRRRRIPIYRPGLADIVEDLNALDRLGT